MDTGMTRDNNKTPWLLLVCMSIFFAFGVPTRVYCVAVATKYGTFKGLPVLYHYDKGQDGVDAGYVAIVSKDKHIKNIPTSGIWKGYFIHGFIRLEGKYLPNTRSGVTEPYFYPIKYLNDRAFNDAKEFKNLVLQIVPELRSKKFKVLSGFWVGGEVHSYHDELEKTFKNFRSSSRASR